jgi:hypothetical protein
MLISLSKKTITQLIINLGCNGSIKVSALITFISIKYGYNKDLY